MAAPQPLLQMNGVGAVENALQRQDANFVAIVNPAGAQVLANNVGLAASALAPGLGYGTFSQTLIKMALPGKDATVQAVTQNQMQLALSAMEAIPSQFHVKFSEAAAFQSVDHRIVIAKIVEVLQLMGMSFAAANTLLQKVSMIAAHAGVRTRDLPEANFSPEIVRTWKFAMSILQLVPGFKISHLLQAFAISSCQAMTSKPPPFAFLGLPRFMMHPQAAAACPTELWNVFGPRIKAFNFHFSKLVSRMENPSKKVLNKWKRSAENFADSIQASTKFGNIYRWRLFAQQLQAEFQTVQGAYPSVQAMLATIVTDAARCKLWTDVSLSANSRAVNIGAQVIAQGTVDLDLIIEPTMRSALAIANVKRWFAQGTNFINDMHFYGPNANLQQFDARYPGVIAFIQAGVFSIGNSTQINGVNIDFDQWRQYNEAQLNLVAPGQHGPTVALNLQPIAIAANGVVEDEWPIILATGKD